MSLRPSGLAVDEAGNIYIADGATHVVLRLTAATGSIDIVAGTRVPGYVGDAGPATQARLASPAGITLDRAGNLYIADRGNHCVRRVDARTAGITTLAGDGSPGASGDSPHPAGRQRRHHDRRGQR